MTRMNWSEVAPDGAKALRRPSLRHQEDEPA